MKIEFPSENQIPELKGLWARCFPDPESFIDGFFATGFSCDRCQYVREGELIAALHWLDAEYRGHKLAYLYAIATDERYRGRGLCRSLMENTHALLKEKGYAACLLLPGEPGLRRMYEKFGYRDQCQITELACEADGEVPVKAISWEEYEALRPQYLPENGALQEGIRFLATYASFYRGGDFLLAAVREGEHLLGLELLGNPEAAPGILGALHCRKGSFRSPGKGKQTVMALALDQGADLPRYFGLTFD